MAADNDAARRRNDGFVEASGAAADVCHNAADAIKRYAECPRQLDTVTHERDALRAVIDGAE